MKKTKNGQKILFEEKKSLGSSMFESRNILVVLSISNYAGVDGNKEENKLYRKMRERNFTLTINYKIILHQYCFKELK